MIHGGKEMTVAFVGRMNVGKSTLFNRISGNVKSLTLDYAGVTRDTVSDVIEWQGKRFEIIDTGGVSFVKTQDEIQEKVRQSALSMLEKAEVIVFVIDGAVGITTEDRTIAGMLHKLGKKTIVVVNKTDRKEVEANIYEAYGLGFPTVIPLSASHGTGINDLLEAIVVALPAKQGKEQDEAKYRVMLLGRPNVGKSSLMNALLQEERTIVSNIPGTTREPISETISFYKEHLMLTDTPGIRRPRSVDSELEQLMVKSAMGALKDTDIILMLIDATEGKLADQDLKLAFYAFSEQYKSMIIIINKSDIVTPEQNEELEKSLDYYKHLIAKVPVIRISCKTGKNVGKILPAIQELWNRTNTTWTPADLKSIFVTALRDRPLMHKKIPLKVTSTHQLRRAPISIVLEVNEPVWFEDSQLGFFENLLRKNKDLMGVPIRFLLKKRKK